MDDNTPARPSADRSIAVGLKMSRIPEFVFPTTLVKEGQQPLREIVANKTYRHNGQLYGFFLYANRDGSVTKARRIFYLVAKEMFLSGNTVYCLSMSDLVAALTTNDYSTDSAAIDNVQTVFVTDFFEDATVSPMSPQEAGIVRAWVRRKFEGGGAVSFLSDADIMNCKSWWPESFLRFLQEHTLVHRL